MELTFGLKERLILANQYEILSKISEDKSDASYFENLAEIFRSGYTRNYEEAFRGFEENELSQEDCKFVVDVLNLYRELYKTWEELEEVHEILEEDDVLFQGFDGNEEDQYYAYCKFLVEDQGLWGELKDLMKEGKINLNSHWPMRNKYENYLLKLKEIQSREEYDVSECLTLEEIEYILK